MKSDQIEDNIRRVSERVDSQVIFLKGEVLNIRQHTFKVCSRKFKGHLQVRYFNRKCWVP